MKIETVIHNLPQLLYASTLELITAHLNPAEIVELLEQESACIEYPDRTTNLCDLLALDLSVLKLNE